jgi:hypothetical protein
MHSAEGNVWKLSYAELAHLCEEIAHNPKNHDQHIRDEAMRIHHGWNDASSINTHEEGARERQVSMLLALRKRTIELVVKTGQALS